MLVLPASETATDTPQPRRRGRLARTLRGLGTGVLAIVLVLLMLASAALGVVVYLVNRPVDDRSHDLQAFDEHPEEDPIVRLGRWDGKAFVPVEPGTVVSPSVTVLVHGLAQGAQDVVEAHDGPSPLLAWDTIRSDGHHQFGWLPKLAKEIAKDEPTRAILAYSWIDDSAISGNPLNARYSQARTELNGHRLARAIEEAVPADDLSTTQVQLIGHSHGARVATVAAVSLPIPPAHLVLLDSPDNMKAQVGGANNNLAPLLRRLDLGSSGTFVDNYYSSYGVPYGDQPGLAPIVDVRLDPGSDLFGATGHGYPPLWYQRSAEALRKAVGFAWSPIRIDQRDFDPPKPGTDLVQNWVRTGKPVPSLELELRPTGQHRGPQRTIEAVELDAHDADDEHDDHDVVELAEDGRRRWHADFEVDDDDVAVELTYRFTDPGDGDQLGIWIDGQLRLVAVGTWAQGDPQTVGIDIANIPAGHHNLSLAVRSFGEGNAQVEAKDFIKLSTPGLDERSRGVVPYLQFGSLVVFLLSAAGLIGLFVHRRHRRARARAVPAVTTR